MANGADLLNGVRISTTNVEDDLSNNTDNEQVRVPHPDPTITMNTPFSVLPGDPFSYTITYQNLNRACARDAYVIHTLPDVFPTGTPDGQSDILLSSITTTT